MFSESVIQLAIMERRASWVHEVLTRQVQEILPSRKGLESLMKKRKIRLYLGVDSTSPQLHLGHAIPLRKLKQFQELGHEVILLFGTFTAQIGDPSGRDKQRQPLSRQTVEANVASYKQQTGKVLDLSRTKILSNGRWLEKIKLPDFLELSSHVTVSQLLGRDMFQGRLQKGGEVWVNEFLYPLLQGYDSVAMDVDLEIGGTDQTFNMLVGRKLQEVYHHKEKFVLTTPLLLGLDGRKMSKTYGNTVNLLDPPQEMYGKLMSLRDELIIHYFEMCTEVPLPEIKKREEMLRQRILSPRDAKAELAKEVVSLYHGENQAQRAAQEFNRVFREKQIPSQMPRLILQREKLPLVELLVKTKLARSKNEARRLVEQGGVRVAGEIQRDWAKQVEIKKDTIFQVGKRRFFRIG